MQSVREGKRQLQSIVTAYNERYDEEYQRYTEIHAHAHTIKPDLPDFGDTVLEANVAIEMKSLLDRDMPKVTKILEFLSEDSSKEAVKAITVPFSCKCKEYRENAIGCLATMKTEHAQKALERRASWLSSAPKKEKKAIKEMLGK